MPEMHYVDSSNVSAIGYDRTSRELHVAFIRGGTYVCYDVDELVFQKFMNAESKGRYFRANIKGRYNDGRKL